MFVLCVSICIFVFNAFLHRVAGHIRIFLSIFRLLKVTPRLLCLHLKIRVFLCFGLEASSSTGSVSE